MNNLETASSIIRLKINKYETKRHLKIMVFIACMIAISFIVVPRLKGIGIYELIESIVLLLTILGFMNIFFSRIRLIDDSIVGYTAELIKEFYSLTMQYTKSGVTRRKETFFQYKISKVSTRFLDYRN